MNTVYELMNYNPVTLEQAKLLKELGFKRPTQFYWQDTDDIPYIEKGLKIGDMPMNHNSIKYAAIQVYSAPSLNDKYVQKILNRSMYLK